MNELIKGATRQEIGRLRNCENFEELFIVASEIKVASDFDGLNLLIEELSNPYYCLKFNSTAIVYLKDSIVAEKSLSFNLKEVIKLSEKNMQKEIADNFPTLFPNYEFECCEKPVKGIGKIDIFAKSGERPVIIELKVGNKNPNTQLIAYGSCFKNPILIGITEKELSKESKHQGITYYTFDELKKGAKSWITN